MTATNSSKTTTCPKEAEEWKDWEVEKRRLSCPWPIGSILLVLGRVGQLQPNWFEWRCRPEPLRHSHIARGCLWICLIPYVTTSGIVFALNSTGIDWTGLGCKMVRSIFLSLWDSFGLFPRVCFDTAKVLLFNSKRLRAEDERLTVKSL